MPFGGYLCLAMYFINQRSQSKLKHQIITVIYLYGYNLIFDFEFKIKR